MIFFTLFFLIQLTSVLLCGIALFRLYCYVTTYRLERGKYDHLFGFIRLRYICYMYVALTLALAGFATYFVIRFY